MLDMAQSEISQSQHDIETGSESRSRVRRHHEHRPKQSRIKVSDLNGHVTHESNRHERHRRSQVAPENTTAVNPGDYFVSDKKGDPGIIRYGSNSSYQIPPYHRTGYGLVLGLSRIFKIDRQQSSNKVIVFLDSAGRSNARNKAVFGKVAKLTEYRVAPVRVDAEDIHKDYLSFSTRRKLNEGSSTENNDSSADEDMTSYRSIHGQAKLGDLIDKDLELNARESFSNETPRSEAETKLQQLVDSEPSNGQAWLDLIGSKFDDSVCGSTHAERISNADIKISMYEKALKHVGSPLKESLLIGLLSEASLVWDHNKLQKKWRDALQYNKNSFVIWIEYLNYVQTTSIRFKFDDLRDAYKDCLSNLNCNIKRLPQQLPHEKLLSSSGNLIYILLRFSICLRQAGYVEQAIAIWQANLERMVCKRKVSGDLTVEQLESFWDSEVERLGEPNALGIDHYLEHGGEAAPEVMDATNQKDSTWSVSRWLANEEDMAASLPARTTDITNEEDAFRVVLFSDIEPYLLTLTTDAHPTLLDGFLLFCGLPSLYQGVSRSWEDDPFVGHEMMVRSSNIDVSFRQPNSDIAHTMGQNCVHTTDILFKEGLVQDARKYPQTNNPGSIWPRRQNLPVPLEWIHVVLEQLIEKTGIENKEKLLEYYLAFELQYFPKQVKKKSKNILKLHPQDLDLYNTHSLIEDRLGNSDASVKILETAIRMRPEDTRIIILKRTLVWKHLENSRSSDAISVLVDHTSLNGEAAIFQMQQDLLAGRDKAITDQGCSSLVTAYVDCLVLLSYLSNPEPLEAAHVVFESNLLSILQMIPQHNKTIEAMYQNMARLQRYHMARHRYRPAFIREVVQKSIRAFPTNTVFLELWQMNEQRYRIHDRVRSVVNDIVSGSPWSSSTARKSPLIGHLFAIDNEIQRAANIGTGSEAVRSAFERALNDKQTKSSPAVWSRYVMFELAGDIIKSKTRHVIERSMAACPWMLNFHLLALGMLGDVEETKKSNSSSAQIGHYDAIVDRELRIHVSMGPTDWT